MTCSQIFCYLLLSKIILKNFLSYLKKLISKNKMNNGNQNNFPNNSNNQNINENKNFEHTSANYQVKDNIDMKNFMDENNLKDTVRQISASNDFCIIIEVRKKNFNKK